MKWTNKHNLPGWVINALDTWERPEEGVYRVTSLMDGPRQRTLQITHWDDIVLDYSDLLMASEGTAIHTFYEDKSPLSEHRFYDRVHGAQITGKPDGYADATIWDIKNKFIGWDKYPDSFEKLERQLNSYAWLCRRKKIPVRRLEAWARLRDWKPMNATREKQYPQCQWQGPYEISLWSFDKQDDYICARLKDHRENPMRLCTEKERMKQETQYKLWNKPKDGNNKATVASVPGTGGKEKITSRKKAMEVAKEKGMTDGSGKLKKGVWIEEVLGEDLRCKYFCSVRSVCDYGKKFAIL